MISCQLGIFLCLQPTYRDPQVYRHNITSLPAKKRPMYIFTPEKTFYSETKIYMSLII